MSGLPDSVIQSQFAQGAAASTHAGQAADLDALIVSKAPQAPGAAVRPLGSSADAPAASMAGGAGAPAPPVPATLPLGKRLEYALAGTPFGAVIGAANLLPGIKDAALGGAAQSLKDLSSSWETVSGGKPATPEAAQSVAAEPLQWKDLAEPETALDKAVFQLAHGAPVLAAGTAGALAGGAATSETGPGAAAGALGGGALGAGAMSAAQGLGPYYASELRRTPDDPSGAFDRALTRAGTDGAFSAAGWAAFGFKPFAGAVKNLLVQALGVQPAVAAAGKVAQNVETGAPATEGAADAALAGAIGTALPAAGLHAAGVGGEGSSEAPQAPARDGAGDKAPMPAIEPDEKPAAVSLGDKPLTPEIAPTPEQQNQVRAFLGGESGDNPVQASLESLSRAPDLNATLTGVASFVPRAAATSDAALRMNAYATGGDLSAALDTGLKGNLPEAEKIGAFALVTNSAGRQFQEVCRKAQASGDPADMAEAARGFTVMQKLIAEWQNVGQEQGQALRARGLVWGDRANAAQQFQDILARVGPDDLDAVIRHTAALTDPAKISPFMASLRSMTGRDGLLFGYYNVLLSNPATVIKKLGSDAATAVWNVATRAAAENFGSGAVRPGETSALIQGYAGSFVDGLKAAAEGLKLGQSQFATEYQGLDGSLHQRLSLLANGHDVDPAAPTASAWSFLRAALPTGWLGAADDFASVMSYRAELRALAVRSGVGKGLDGDDLAGHVSDTLNSPPSDLHEQAVSAALRNTYKEPLTGLAAKVQDLADAWNVPVGWHGFELPVGRLLLPFLKAPANLLKGAYRSSPLPLAFPSDAFKAELAQGGATRDLALAKVGLGTGVTVAVLGLALGGTMTGAGPSAPELRRAWLAAGNQPHSIRIGGTWYGYNKIDPLGILLGTVADSVDVVRYAKQQDAEQVASSLVFGVGNSMMSKTYLTGLSSFFDALHSPDQEGDKYVSNLLASLAVPQAATGLERATDEWRRAHQGLLETIESRIPGLAEGLPPQRTLWGDPIPWADGYLPPVSGTGAARMLSPISTAAAEAKNPIDRWIWDNRAAFAQGPAGRLDLTPPGRTMSFSTGPHLSASVELTPQAYDRFRVLAGNELKDGRGLGARDLLDALVQDKGPPTDQSAWNRASPAEQALAVQSIVHRYQASAKAQILREFPDIADAVKAGIGQRQQQLQAQAQPGGNGP